VPISSTNADFVLKMGGRIELKLIDKATNKKVSGDDVEIKPAIHRTAHDGRTGWWDGIATEKLVTTTDGTFLFKGLEPGNYYWIYVRQERVAIGQLLVILLA